MEIFCVDCGKPYPESGAPYHCMHCGGLFDFVRIPPYQKPDNPLVHGIWRYYEIFCLPEHAPQISLGEGDTPLLWADVKGRKVAFKCEYQNPTGSFKDRGSALLTSFLVSRGIQQVVEDSSGNAGASLAAYTARSGIRARIFVPQAASGPKVKQIEAYGAELVKVAGSRSEVTQAVLEEINHRTIYASHAYMPFNIPGYATLAYEIYEQLGASPGTIICPVGQGGLFLGIGRGFIALQQAGLISHVPLCIGVQARAYSPLCAGTRDDREGVVFKGSDETIAEGIRISTPVRKDAILHFARTQGGYFTAVDDEEIIKGRDELAQRGFYVETTSAIIWHVLVAENMQMKDPIVAVLTGSGLKNVY